MAEYNFKRCLVVQLVTAYESAFIFISCVSPEFGQTRSLFYGPLFLAVLLLLLEFSLQQKAR